MDKNNEQLTITFDGKELQAVQIPASEDLVKVFTQAEEMSNAMIVKAKENGGSFNFSSENVVIDDPLQVSSLAMFSAETEGKISRTVMELENWGEPEYLKRIVLIKNGEETQIGTSSSPDAPASSVTVRDSDGNYSTFICKNGRFPALGDPAFTIKDSLLHYTPFRDKIGLMPDEEFNKALEAALATARENGNFTTKKYLSAYLNGATDISRPSIIQQAR